MLVSTLLGGGREPERGAFDDNTLPAELGGGQFATRPTSCARSEGWHHALAAHRQRGCRGAARACPRSGRAAPRPRRRPWTATADFRCAEHFDAILRQSRRLGGRASADRSTPCCWWVRLLGFCPTSLRCPVLASRVPFDSSSAEITEAAAGKVLRGVSGSPYWYGEEVPNKPHYRKERRDGRFAHIADRSVSASLSE